jgi:hypothetical protein
LNDDKNNENNENNENCDDSTSKQQERYQKQNYKCRTIVSQIIRQ